jgi:uncharacterized protein (DUF1501 family)
MQRRRFLQSTLAGLAWPSTRLWAAPAAGQAKFLLVFLRGACDMTNVLVPWANDFYYASRPNIAVPRPDSGADAAAARLDAQWALHPALRDSLLPLWQAGTLGFVPFAGSDDLSRSHFETQDRIELGLDAQASATGADGFLNRLLRQLGAPARPIAFSAQLPLALQGAARVPNLDLTRAPRDDFGAHQQRLLESMWRGTAQGDAVREGFAVRASAAQLMQDTDRGAEMIAASRGAVNPRGFVAEAQRIGALMAGGYDIGFVDVGGWDTHVNEGDAAHGQLAGKLQDLGAGLAALATALGPRWRDTVVVVLSEFGRTFRENGDRGTDHGHGTAYWVLGGGVRGGRVAGAQIVQAPQTLNQNRDDPVLNPGRDLLGGVFARLWDLRPEQLQTIFPASRPLDLRLL